MGGSLEAGVLRPGSHVLVERAGSLKKVEWDLVKLSFLQGLLIIHRQSLIGASLKRLLWGKGNGDQSERISLKHSLHQWAWVGNVVGVVEPIYKREGTEKRAQQVLGVPCSTTITSFTSFALPTCLTKFHSIFFFFFLVRTGNRRLLGRLFK